MKLRAMLVDDEPIILQNLQTVVPWESLEIEVAAVATNGQKALEIAEQIRPDLILSDIRMPKMDGIDFLRQLRELDIECEVVMLTGYGEFEYARSVMRHGVRNYLLKPIDYEELQRVVAQTAAEIRQRKSLNHAERRTKDTALNLAYEKMLTEALVGTFDPAVQAMLAADGMDVADASFHFWLADIDSFANGSVVLSKAERKVWNFAVRNVMEETLRENARSFILLQLREGEYCIFIADPDGEEGWTRQVSAQVQHSIRQYTKQQVSIAYQLNRVSLDELHETYRNLQLTLRMTPDRQQTLVAAETPETKDCLNVSMWKDMEEVVSALKRMKRDELEEAWGGLGRRINELAEQSQLRAVRMLSYLNLYVIRELEDMKLLDDAEKQNLWARMETERTLEELLEDIRLLLSKCLEASLKRKPGDVLMLRAKEYIERHIADDIGIDELAEVLGISSSYFSLLFKQHFGVTFVEHITRQRIELAQSLLAFSDNSVANIGKQVGYQERRYFTKVFQKYVGLTPSEYRESRLS
ncbi:response regulator [Paenibacillus sp. GCM10027626]|uniref:response regulator transcription factor n=1 Tax=Paenibacillus sp. GCM10027626 TaxID=3273411 RepID=UPI00364475DA